MSESEEMYLISIARLKEDGIDGPIPLSQLAAELSVLPVSVNQMIHKMDGAGLVRYLPYKGVELTQEGSQIAARMLRLRRLWEVFLVEKLDLSLEEADDLACRMEHIMPDGIADQLSIFLDSPIVSPEGKPIPEGGGGDWSATPQPLSNLKVGQGGVVVNLETDDSTGAFLSGEGVRPGAEVHILVVSDSGVRLVQTGGKKISLVSTVAEKIIVRNQKEKLLMSSQQVPLSKLKVGESGAISAIKIKGAARRRFLDMGLVTGEIIKVERVAPLGDPIDFVVKGYHLSLRKNEAKQIMVDVKNAS